MEPQNWTRIRRIFRRVTARKIGAEKPHADRRQNASRAASNFDTRVTSKQCRNSAAGRIRTHRFDDRIHAQSSPISRAVSMRVSACKTGTENGALIRASNRHKTTRNFAHTVLHAPNDAFSTTSVCLRAAFHAFPRVIGPVRLEPDSRGPPCPAIRPFVNAGARRRPRPAPSRYPLAQSHRDEQTNG